MIRLLLAAAVVLVLAPAALAKRPGISWRWWISHDVSVATCKRRAMVFCRERFSRCDRRRDGVIIKTGDSTIAATCNRLTSGATIGVISAGNNDSYDDMVATVDDLNARMRYGR
ncbi:MAG: hypothetical protein MRY74_06510 [Neomegalonema sp.]|nr:hypothetical protein [Neomegalonema sp.]